MDDRGITRIARGLVSQMVSKKKEASSVVADEASFWIQVLDGSVITHSSASTPPSASKD